jgi:hypothetical protein
VQVLKGKFSINNLESWGLLVESDPAIMQTPLTPDRNGGPMPMMIMMMPMSNTVNDESGVITSNDNTNVGKIDVVPYL